MASRTRDEDAFAADLDIVLRQAAPEQPLLPSLPAAALAAALLDAGGRLVWRDANFIAWVDETAIDPAPAARVRAHGGVEVTHGLDREGQALALTFAQTADMAEWPVHLPPGASGIAVVAVSLAHLDDDVIAAARAFGMTNLEARISAALVRHGALPQAAAHCGIAYETAREAADGARAKAGVARLPQLVSRLTTIVTVAQPRTQTVERILVDVFGLTPREATLTLALTQARSRGEAATMAGMSEAVAKKQFAHIFETLGVSTAPQVSRLITQTVAAALLSGAGARDLPLTRTRPEDPRHQDLRLIVRRGFDGDAGAVAITDHGPATGRPVIVTHSGSATRLIPASLVTRLHAAGFRPIAIDRPGFGLTDPHPALACPWAAAAADMALVQDALRLPASDFLVRGGIYAVCALARAAPHRIGRVVALNPDVSSLHSHKRLGAIGMLWQAAERYPERQEAVTRWLATRTTPAQVARLLRMLIRHSPPDLAVFENTAELADFQRGATLFATGRVSGTIAEHQGHAAGVECPPVPDARHWHILLGAHDPMHDTPDMARFWAPRLPAAAIETLPDAGRFIHLSHPERVLAALAR